MQVGPSLRDSLEASRLPAPHQVTLLNNVPAKLGEIISESRGHTGSWYLLGPGRASVMRGETFVQEDKGLLIPWC